MATPVLQFKRGAFSNLPALKAGEPGFTTDKYDFYIGLDNTSGNNKFFGSHRYWTREQNTVGSGVNLVEGLNNGTDYVTLRAPASVGAAVTFVFPGSQGAVDTFLRNDGSGNLSWSSTLTNVNLSNANLTGITTIGATDLDVNAGSIDISGITTFSNTTDNTLGDENTGAVQLDGGMGIAKNLTVKQNLHVGGFSEFVGVATFRGGTINLGDSDTDDVVIGGEFASHLIPTTNNLYDLGAGGKAWRNANFAGVGTFATGAVIDAVQIGQSGTAEIDTSAGNLTLDSAGGTVTVDDNLTVTAGNDITLSDLTANRVLLAGASSEITDSADLTFSSNVLTVANTIDVTTVEATNLKAKDGTTAITISDSSGNVGCAADLTVSGNFTVLGSTTEVNTETLLVEDSLIEVGLVNSGGSLVAPSSDANIDVGVVFHYYDSAARKAAIYWDDSVSRIVVASQVSETSSVLTASTYADFEIGGLYVNDCAGSSQVISCTGSERFLENITIDAGTF